MKYRVTKINLNNSQHELYIWIKDVAHYTEKVSFGYFFAGNKKRNRSKKFLYVTHWDSDLKTPEIYKWYTIENVPEVTVDNLWDFYKLIGYDHKKNKYQ